MIRQFFQTLWDGQERLDPAMVAGAVDSAIGARMSNTPPKGEAIVPVPGSGMNLTREDHQHKRLTSAVVGSIVSGNTAAIQFTRGFPSEPTIDYMELPPASDTTTPAAADTATGAQPTMAKVVAWSFGPTTRVPDAAPTDYTGCTVRVWKGQVIPQNLSTLLLGAVYSIFAASVVGTRFSIIALARSDV